MLQFFPILLGLESVGLETPAWRPYAAYPLGIIMFLTAIFLILLVLVQRGRGGGLAGAFGGAGGQSAFGAKAGDTFTRLTIYAATFWILLCMTSVVVLNKTVGAGDVKSESGLRSPTTPAESETGLGSGAGATESPDATTDSGSTGTGSTDGESTEGGESGSP